MIQLNKDWFVKPDGSGWALVKTVKGTSKQGEPITRDKTIGYFGTLHRAVRRFTDEMAKEATDIDNTVEILRQCLVDIEVALKETK